jgi:hypothetical protein
VNLPTFSGRLTEEVVELLASGIEGSLFSEKGLGADPE